MWFRSTPQPHSNFWNGHVSLYYPFVCVSPYFGEKKQSLKMCFPVLTSLQGSQTAPKKPSTVFFVDFHRAPPKKVASKKTAPVKSPFARRVGAKAKPRASQSPSKRGARSLPLYGGRGVSKWLSLVITHFPWISVS